jgi:hypothetical protein
MLIAVWEVEQYDFFAAIALTVVISLRTSPAVRSSA